MKFKNPFCPEKHEILKKSIELMAAGTPWKKVALAFRDEHTLSYVAERLVRVGYLWVDSFDLSDKEIKMSMALARKAHADRENALTVLAKEEELLRKPDAIKHTHATFVFGLKNGVAVDENLLDDWNLDYVDIMKTENQEGWYVLNHDGESVYMDGHSSNLM